MSKTVVGVIGGTGLYSFDGLNIRETLEVDTPYGSPSSPLVRATLENCDVLFLSRHGEGHRILPTEINSRANIFALKSLGASWCISVSAVGSLQDDYRPGDMAVPDQLIDRTYLRNNTFFGEGIVGHVSFADPFCPVLSEALRSSAEKIHPRRVHQGGTYVCMEGPAFSTRAESQLYRSWGASLIGMTALPEAKLAREAEMSYAILATVTDYDCWKSREADVDVSEIFRILSENADSARSILLNVIPQLAERQQPEFIADALKYALITDRSKISPLIQARLRPLLSRYIPSS